MVLAKNTMNTMDNKEIKNERQVRFFELIRKTLPSHINLVNEMSDFLGLSVDAAYRRIRGDKPIYFEEAIALSRKYHLSMDAVAEVVTDKKQFSCEYAPIDIGDLKNYLVFAQNFSASIESLRLASESEIIFTAADIPVFNFLSYHELTFFILFSWYKNTCGFPAGYEDFVKEMDINELKRCYEKIVRNYQMIPSSEIWSQNTVDSFLRLLGYHSEMKHFNDNKIPLFICEQLFDLINTLSNWTEKGTKGTENTPFKFYVSEIDIGNTFIIFKNAKSSKCLVRLYTINGLSISDDHFCQETERWLHNIARSAMLVSGASERERFKFFENQRQKIRFLTEEIQSRPSQ